MQKKYLEVILNLAEQKWENISKYSILGERNVFFLKMQFNQMLYGIVLSKETFLNYFLPGENLSIFTALASLIYLFSVQLPRHCYTVWQLTYCSNNRCGAARSRIFGLLCNSSFYFNIVQSEFNFNVVTFPEKAAAFQFRFNNLKIICVPSLTLYISILGRKQGSYMFLPTPLAVAWVNRFSPSSPSSPSPSSPHL